ncbi:hypothetical protein OROHE_001885 [Orobanche hederae]
MMSYNVVSYGAKGDGRTDSTSSFHRAWTAACASARPASVSVPRGTFLVGPLTFTGPCRNRILFEISGTIVAPDNYNVIGNSAFWILFHKVSRLTVVGGTIDAKGSKFWSCRRGRFNRCPGGARGPSESQDRPWLSDLHNLYSSGTPGINVLLPPLLVYILLATSNGRMQFSPHGLMQLFCDLQSMSFEWCINVIVRGLRSFNSQTIHISINHSSNVKVQNVKITAPSGSPNTDGIHISSSRGVTVTDSVIRTGDDCISIGPGSMNLWMERIGCGPGHGISIGSLADSYNEQGVQNVTVTKAVFTKTQNGVRVKSWARRSIGYARNLVFSNIVMRNVANPIIVDQKYCPSGSCPHQ